MPLPCGLWKRPYLMAILFHFMTNVTYILANVTAGTIFYSTLRWMIAAIAVVAVGARGTPNELNHARSGQPTG